MPEYLSPGMYVEDVPRHAGRIDGVATDVAGFLGASPQGPANQPIGPIRTLAQYTQKFGDGCDSLLQAVRAFFTEGGRQLWVTRVVDGNYARGLEALANVDEIATIAAPGATDASACRLLVGYAERTRRCIALLDPPQGWDVKEVVDWSRQFASSYAALYYPWIKAHDPASRRELLLPPSGAIAGLIARSDELYGVHKAPANLDIRIAAGLERELDSAQQEMLNAHGVNCLRAFRDLGVRVWGSRTLALDPQWKYVNIRRLFLYLEQSIRKGAAWAVFEPNGAPLWAKLRDAVTNFLLREWRLGRLIGSIPEDAFHVRWQAGMVPP